MPSINKSNVFLLYMTFVSILITFIYFVFSIETQNIILVQLTTVAIPIIIYPFIFKIKFKYFCFEKINIKTAFLVIVLAILMKPISMVIGVISVVVIPGALEGAEQVEGFLSSANLFQQIVIISIIPAIFEEIAIRGIVMSGYAKHKAITASIFSGIIFGFFHMNIYQFLYTAVLGFVIALVLRYGASIFYCMIFHFVFNTISLLTSLIETGESNSSTPPVDINSIQSYEYMMAFGVLSILLIISIFFVIKILKKIKVINEGKYEKFVLNTYGSEYLNKEEDIIKDITNISEENNTNAKKNEKHIVNYMYVFAGIVSIIVTIILQL